MPEHVVVLDVNVDVVSVDAVAAVDVDVGVTLVLVLLFQPFGLSPFGTTVLKPDLKRKRKRCGFESLSPKASIRTLTQDTLK